MAWQLLNSQADWDAYRVRVTNEHSLQQAAIVFGTGPQQYPCLIDGLMTSPTKFLTAYVYMDDAAKLFPNGYGDVAQQAEQQQAVFGPPGGHGVQTQIPGHLWKEFANSVSAHLLAQLSYLVDTGICTEEAYQAKYVGFLAKVDQWTAEDRAKALEQLPGAKRVAEE